MTISKLVVAATLSACALSTAQAQYSVQNLGRLPGTTDAYGFAINATGAVAGRNLGDSDRAFLYSAGTLLDLGTLPGGVGAIAYDLNDAGQVVGDSSSGVGARAFIYSAGVMTSLGTLGGAGSFAGGINNFGQVVGWSNSPAGDRAFLYSAGTMISLGALPGASLSVATEIADNSTVIGYSGSVGPGGSIQGFTYSSGVMTGFGPTGSGQSTRPEGINELGTVVGRTTAWGGFGGSTTGPSDGNLAFSFIGGVLSQLPAIPGSTSSGAYDVNESGVIVGSSYVVSAGTHRATLWDTGVVVDLNTLLLPGSNWQLFWAYGINDSGQIVGIGREGSEAQLSAFLLSPVPNAPSILLMLAGLAVVGGASRSMRARGGS